MKPPFPKKKPAHTLKRTVDSRCSLAFKKDIHVSVLNSSSWLLEEGTRVRVSLSLRSLGLASGRSCVDYPVFDELPCRKLAPAGVALSETDSSPLRSQNLPCCVRRRVFRAFVGPSSHCVSLRDFLEIYPYLCFSVFEKQNTYNVLSSPKVHEKHLCVRRRNCCDRMSFKSRRKPV